MIISKEQRTETENVEADVRKEKIDVDKESSRRAARRPVKE